MDKPAFPNNFISEDRRGMTLRDYFAAKAMQAVVSRGLVPQVPLEIYAENAYKMADAMIGARNVAQ